MVQTNQVVKTSGDASPCAAAGYGLMEGQLQECRVGEREGAEPDHDAGRATR
ncbi:hypothetical protein ACFYSH_04605 [Streptomyces sp. NPDC005791]|uniref:hypothetical protein n=1 Tax=unclassified Streptomyces TaxID=2593676 RepID=UPI0033FE01FD